MAGIGRFQHTGAAPQTNLSISMGSGDTSFTAASGTGYPDGSVGDFVVAIDPGLPSEEHILCSSRSGAVFTVAGSGRGYDNTSAAAHTAPTALIEHIVAATEIDDASRHINPTASVPSDDHLNYPLLTGARAFTGGVTINTGGLTVTAGGVTVTAGGATITGTTAVTGAITASSTDTATKQIATLSGTNSALAGLTNGAPSSGTYATGDILPDITNSVIWVCTSGGTPGTWYAIGGGNYRARYHGGPVSAVPGSPAVLKLTTSRYDPHSSYSSSTGLYTVPNAGYYQVSSGVGVSGLAAGQFMTLAIFQNGGTITELTSPGQGISVYSYAFITDVISCAAGDTLAIYTSTAQSNVFYNALDDDVQASFGRVA